MAYKYLLMKKLFALLLVVFSFSTFSKAASKEGEAFNPGEMITHHIGDDYTWHFADGLVLNLPVILYGENGLDIFSAGIIRVFMGQTYPQ